MGEYTCLLPSFSPAATATHCASTQLRDPMHALTESVSFGRFISDSLAWDKWSNLSHKRYVEEAASYSRPGSVAQKKAFFEEYYKKKALLAKENAAAAASAISSQDRESNNDDVAMTTDSADLDARVTSISVNNVIQNEGIHVPQQDGCAEQKEIVATDSFVLVVSISGSEDDDKEHLGTLTDVVTEATQAEPEISAATTEVSEDSEMEKPLLKDQEVCSSMRKPKPSPVTSLKPAAKLWPSASIPCPPPKPLNSSRKENATPTNSNSAIESLDKIRESPKPLFAYMSRTPSRDVNRRTTTSARGAAKDSITPLRTPIMAPQAKKSTITPRSENRRNTTPLASATPGNRTTGPKWRFLGSLENKQRPSPSASTPFKFKTEERAAKRKEKLELKFNAKAPLKVQLQTKLKDKAESELKKLRESLCFRARPLPSFYKERKAQKDNLILANPVVAKKSPERPQSRKTSKDAFKGLPPPTPERPYTLQKNKVSSTSVTTKSSKGHPRSLAAMISSENNSPNIPILPPKKMKTDLQYHQAPSVAQPYTT